MKLTIAPYKRKCEHYCDCKQKATVIMDYSDDFAWIDDKGLARCEECLSGMCLKRPFAHMGL